MLVSGTPKPLTKRQAETSVARGGNFEVAFSIPEIVGFLRLPSSLFSVGVQSEDADPGRS